MLKNKGITLIALVVTIVVLLILAGVSITAVFGENGIISGAQKAKEKTDESIKQEQEDVGKLVNQLEDFEREGLPDTVKDAIQKGTIFTVNKQIKDATGKTMTVPKGFKVKEGTDVDKGIVIADSEGNEFVWVPCTEVQYVKHSYTGTNNNDAGIDIEDDGNAGWNTWYYRAYGDWKGDPVQEPENAKSVKNNRGFYIARYEAGIPSNMEGVYVDPKAEVKTYNTSGRNTSNYVPVSQKGKQAWNYIDQTNAKAASEKMYAGNESVSSQLVDGIAWDRTVQWIVDSGKYQHTGIGNAETSESIEKDSTTKGNYSNNTGITENNILWAEHINADGVGWCLGKSYKYGKFTSGYTETYTGPFNDFNGYNSDQKYSYIKFVEMSTGASEDTKLNNIYDLAGNMWEWTTERGSHKDASNINQDYANKTYAVYRGGCFADPGNAGPVSHRNGVNLVSDARINYGFRVVLYVR